MAIVRKNFDFKPDDYRVMRRLKKQFGAASITEAIRRSTRLSAKFMELQIGGGKLVVEKPDGSKETILIIT